MIFWLQTRPHLGQIASFKINNKHKKHQQDIHIESNSLNKFRSSFGGNQEGKTVLFRQSLFLPHTPLEFKTKTGDHTESCV